MKNTIEVILKVGSEGGFIALSGIRKSLGWRFSRYVLDQTPQMIDEEAIEHESDFVDSWQAALELLAEYPWVAFSPIQVHPEFRRSVYEAVLEIFAARTELPNRSLEKWKALCCVGLESNQQPHTQHGASDVEVKIAPSLDEQCGRHFLYRNFIECGETYEKYKKCALTNLPKELESYGAIKCLASNILDPTREKFGKLHLTYGFSSLELINKIPGRISPANDQHAAHEKRKTGKYICSRLGAACDFKVDGLDMRMVVEWIYFNTPVDRIYFYGTDRPIHVSFSPSGAHQFVELIMNYSGRRVPRVVRLANPRNAGG